MSVCWAGGGGHVHSDMSIPLFLAYVTFTRICMRMGLRGGMCERGEQVGIEVLYILRRKGWVLGLVGRVRVISGGKVGRELSGIRRAGSR